MGTVLGRWRLCVAILVFSVVVLPSVELPGSDPIGMGAAWADDDDDDDSGSGSGSGGGSGSGAASGGGASGGSAGGGSDTGTSRSSGAFAGNPGDSDSGPDRRIDALREARLDAARGALSADPRLVGIRSGAWNLPYRDHAVRDEFLALGVRPTEIGALARAGYTLLDRTNMGSLGLIASRFSLPAGQDIASALSDARQYAPGAVLVPNYVYRFAGDADPGPCSGAGCYGHTLIGWEQVAEGCGAGIRIGMTDTGVDRNHPALRGQALWTETFDPFGTGSVPDHGTAVAGLLVGNAETGFPGMLPGAELFAADVFHTNDDGESYSTLLSLVSGLDWLVENRVQVINVSMAGPPNDLLEETIRRMNARGVVVVAAAGNGGPLAPPAYPAAYPDVISVTAVDQELRPYSMANRGAYISFSSPGVRIWSAGEAGSGRHRTGTSFAAAHATAIVADVVRHGGGRGDIGKVLGALQSTARDLGVPGKDPIFGWGLIQGTPACQI